MGITFQLPDDQVAVMRQLHRQAMLSTCTIEAQTGTTVDDYGQVQETWTSVAGLVDIDCGILPLSAFERQGLGYTVTDRVFNVWLDGDYPSITTAHRAVIDGTTYDIDAAVTDQMRIVTRLRVRLVGV